VRGRERLVTWDGSLRVIGNSILAATPINFWNADQPLQLIGDERCVWKSVTTGGLAGVVLTLQNSAGGALHVETTQRAIDCELQAVGLEPIIWDCGGLRKQIAIYRLPDTNPSLDLSFERVLHELPDRESPIIIRVTQEDGHMAWTSPITVVRQADRANAATPRAGQ